MVDQGISLSQYRSILPAVISSAEYLVLICYSTFEAQLVGEAIETLPLQ